MVTFVLGPELDQARLGRITGWGSNSPENEPPTSLDHETPSFMVYTRAGHIPHLTWDNVGSRLHFRQTPIYQLSYPNLVGFFPQCRKLNKPLGKVLPMPKDALTHLSLFDPLGIRNSTYNTEKAIAIWAKGGKTTVTPEKFLEIVQTVKPHSTSLMLDYDVPADCQNKRITKSVMRTLKFWQDTVNENLTAAPFIALGGGLSEFHRTTMATNAAVINEATGYTVDLLQYSNCKLIKPNREFDREEVKELVSHSFKPLDENKVRLVEGAFSPSQIFDLIQVGFDLFDSSFTSWAAENGQSFQVHENFPENNSFTILDFTTDEWSKNLTPVYDNCECYTCKHYTKAYIAHLFNARELLGPLLLSLHNLHEFDRFFELIRKFLKGKSP